MTREGLDHWSQVQQCARDRATVLGLPRTSLEAWRHVDVRPLARVPQVDPSNDCTVSDSLPTPLRALPTVLIVDGVVRSLPTSPELLALVALDDLPLSRQQALAASWLDQLRTQEDVTACWSLEQAGQGLHITARRGATPPAPVLVVLAAQGGASSCRLVFDVEAQATLEVVVLHLDAHSARSSVGIEATIGDEARLLVDEVQMSAHQGETDQLFSHVQLTQARNSLVHWTSCLQGGVLVRSSLSSALLQPGARMEFANLATLDGTRQAHVLTRILHAVGMTTSSQLVRTVADGHGVASFDGQVVIAKGADGAQARQRHQNLLLSSDARVDTRPQLDIHADDVQAVHGATVGRPDPEEIFYLRSRGLDPKQALAVLMRGFAEQTLVEMHNPLAQSVAQDAILPTLVRT